MGAVLPPFMPAFQMGPMPGMHMQLEDEAKRGFAQICFDFTKGTCLRGDACKYSHDIAHIVQVNSKERGICFDFLRGQCARGLLCRFSHDLSGIVAQQQLQQLQGASAATKRGAPICYDFVKGMCSRGAECRYSHDISSVIHGHQGRPATASEPCFDFLRGKCGRGKSCRYSHDLPLPNPGCWPAGVPMPSGMMSTYPPSLPQSLPMLQGGLAPMGMPGTAGLPPHINALRSNGAVLGNLSNFSIGMATARMAHQQQQQQQMGLHGGQHCGAQAHCCDPSRQSFQLVAHMAALQAANAAAAQGQAHQAMQQQMSERSSLDSQSVLSEAPSRAPSRQNSHDDLARGMLKLQLMQQQQQQQRSEPLSKKGSAASDDSAGDFNDAKIRAVWEQQAAALPPLVTAQRSLPQSGTCTPGTCTPRTPALPPQHPHSNLSRQSSFAALPSSLGAPAPQLAATAFAGQYVGYDAHGAGCGFAPRQPPMELPAFAALAHSGGSGKAAPLQQHTFSLPQSSLPQTRSVAASAHAFAAPPPSRQLAVDLAPQPRAMPRQPGTAPAMLCHPFSAGLAAATATSVPPSRPGSQPGSARAGDVGAFSAAYTTLFDPMVRMSTGQPAARSSLSAQTSATQEQVQAWAEAPERPPSAAADPQLLTWIASAVESGPGSMQPGYDA